MGNIMPKAFVTSHHIILFPSECHVSTCSSINLKTQLFWNLHFLLFPNSISDATILIVRQVWHAKTSLILHLPSPHVNQCSVWQILFLQSLRHQPFISIPWPLPWTECLCLLKIYMLKPYSQCACIWPNDKGQRRPYGWGPNSMGLAPL